VSDLVAEGVTGAEDLSAYGSWQTVPGTGDVWVPPVDPDWAPYSDGDWAWVDPWGWTWVDAAPWGFAPFHYGRWTYSRTRWVWVPGPRNTPQVYAPHLVTFVGGGANDVSWFPLGPREMWTPSWRPPTDALNPPRVSMNRAMPGAIRSLSQADFIAGNRVRPMIGLAPEGEVLGSSPNTMPVRDSVLMGNVKIRPPLTNRPLIARTAPPPPPISFVAQLSFLAQNRGRPLAPKQVALLRRQLPAAVMQSAYVRSSMPLVNSPRAAKSVAKPADKAAKPKAAPGTPARSGS